VTQLLTQKIALNTPPIEAFEKIHNLPYSFFLDSALNIKDLGRFSFMGCDPFLIFSSKKDHLTLDWIDKKESFTGNPFLMLKKIFKMFKIHEEAPFPFTGGGIGYFSYDLKDFNERLPDYAKDDLNIPDCIVCFYDTCLVYDLFSREYHILSTGFPEKGKKRIHRRKVRAERLKKRIYSETKGITYKERYIKNVRLESNFEKDTYISTIKKAKQYIKAGDIYQVNLSQRFRTTLPMEAFNLYRILRAINPAPFASFLNYGRIKVLSASPERFIKKEGENIETRPIKGTRPRGKDIKNDKRLKEQLKKSIKDRAENLMIIDLERNDLGRISEYGSVHVSEFMSCEAYATVFHLVSTVRGILKKDIDAMDCLINCFPGGSITGAPKIRSMEIIEELEPVKRSIYTGSIGYISFTGDMDTSIVIRTMTVKDEDVYFHVGGGIVYDSDPEKEYEETLHKAKALIDAIDLASKKHNKRQVFTKPVNLYESSIS